MTDKIVKHVGGKTFINGTKEIIHQRVFHYADGTKEIEEISYPFIEITPRELFQKRKSLKPGFVLKINGKLLYADLPKYDTSPRTLGVGEHLCFYCKRGFAKSEKDGGCSKIRDLFPKIPKNWTLKADRWESSNCMLEKYPFITYGYEHFNIPKEKLVVSKCKNFEFVENEPKKILTKEEFKQKKLALAQYIAPDAKTLYEAKEIIKRS